MDTIDKINELNNRKEKIELGGGADRIARQHQAGKMTARERQAAL
jgi:acetyl-CoA carboxylase carboxyltransferase component